MRFKILEIDKIYKIFSKGKHIIFIHDVENKLRDFKHDNREKMKELYHFIFPFINKEMDDCKYMNFITVIIEAFNVYMLQFKTFKDAKDYFQKIYFPNRDTRLNYKEQSFCIALYSNGKFECDLL